MPPTPAIEAEFEIYVLVKIKGHGSDEHKMKMAATIKRQIQVSTHREVEVAIMDREPKGASTPVKLDKRNALAGWDDPPRAE